VTTIVDAAFPVAGATLVLELGRSSPARGKLALVAGSDALGLTAADSRFKLRPRPWPGVAVTGSPFCEHHKLRMSCEVCKASMAPPPASYVARGERDERAEAPKRESRKPGGVGPRGAGKPLLPTRARKRGVTADEAERAQAWWVRK
jgi:hypothetical protein